MPSSRDRHPLQPTPPPPPPSPPACPGASVFAFKWKPLKINQNLNHICPFSHEKIGHVRVTRRSCFCSSVPRFSVFRDPTRYMRQPISIFLTWSVIINDDKSCVRSISFSHDQRARCLSVFDSFQLVSHLFMCRAAVTRPG